MVYVCGTGGGNFPKPGDPNLNDTAVNAHSVFMGIYVSWLYPNIHPEAVHRTNIYRGTTEHLENARRHRIVTGDAFLDEIQNDRGTRYYYWVQHISVHGTEGEIIGPASALMPNTSEQILKELNGHVGLDILDQDLVSRIHTITTIRDGLLTEQSDRIGADNLLGQALQASIDSLNEVDALLQQEVLARVDGQEALLQEINLLYTQSGNTDAAILEERMARVDGDNALATAIDTVSATLTDLSEEVDGLPAQYTAAIQENNTAMIGYCEINDNPAYQFQTPAVCEANGGIWVPAAPFSQTLLVSEVRTGDGGTATYSQIGETFQNIDGELRARGAILTNVDGLVSGFVNVNDGSESSFDVIANQFRWGVPGGTQGFIPYLSMEDVNGAPTATFRGRVVLEGVDLTSPSDIQNLDGARFIANRYDSVSSASATITSRWTELVGRPPKTGDTFQQTRPATGPAVATAIHRFNGTEWTSTNPALVVSGDMVTFGTIKGAAFETTNYSASNRTGVKIFPDGRIEINGVGTGSARLTITNSKLEVRDNNNRVRVELGLL